MKTLTKEQQHELSKVQLFNVIYNTNFKVYTDDYKDWNGITLAEHVKQSNWEAPENKPVIHGNVRRVSPNGMNRQISFHMASGSEILDITYLMSWVIDEREPKQDKYGRNILRVHGTGMDMVFHMVYTLGIILFRGLESDIDRAGYMIRHSHL